MGERSKPDADHGREAAEAREEAPPPFWEWMVAGLGAALLLASIGYLLLQAREEASPPQPQVQVLAIEPQAGGFHVQLRVRNAGRQTAAALRLEGELRAGGQVLERSETELDYLPGESTREAGLFFQTDPRSAQFAVQPRGYRQP